MRLSVERQLGYKQAKYVMSIEMADRLGQLGRGNGGFGKIAAMNGMPAFDRILI